MANFAATHNIVVELAGGVLSHAYYMLQRQGAQVECIDLFGADEDVIEYNKLVRDKIPALIRGGGEDVEILQLRGDALLTALRQKLVEEAFEVIDAKSADELISELADVKEVINGICTAVRVTEAELENERTKKANRRGGFETGTMLTRTSMPGSISRMETSPTGAFSMATIGTPTAQIVQESSAIPANPPYRRADLRNVGQHLERVLTFETGLNQLGNLREQTSFSIPVGSEQSRRFVLTIELGRNRSLIRGDVRVRESEEGTQVSDSQLRFSFDE